MSSWYCSAVSNSDWSAPSESSTFTIHPFPYGSVFTNSGSPSNSSLNSITLPETGKYKSETVFTASTLPNTSPAFKSSSTVSTSTKTMSPYSLCAKSVIPTVATFPSSLTHS